jgi:histone H3/H4
MNTNHSSNNNNNSTTTTTTKTTKKKATAKKASSAAGTKAKTKTNTTTAPRKRKATSTAARHQLIANDARASAATLSQQQANSLARRSDPLWYRIEDVVPAAHLPPVGASLLSSSTNANAEQQPTKKSGGGSAAVDEFQALENALHRHGKTRADVTPQALACLLEHARRYRQEVWQDAREYAEVAGRNASADGGVTKADLQLAADFRHDASVALATQLPKLNLLAQQVNRKPLPPIPNHVYGGVWLPPSAYQVAARTFDVVSGAAAAQKMQLPFPRAPARMHEPRSNLQSLYGAGRGRQIPIVLKTTTVVAVAPPTAVTPTGPTAPTTTEGATVVLPAVPMTDGPTVPASTAAAPTTVATPAVPAPATAAATTLPATTAPPASSTTTTGPTPMDISTEETPTPMDTSEAAPTPTAADSAVTTATPTVATEAVVTTTAAAVTTTTSEPKAALPVAPPAP